MQKMQYPHRWASQAGTETLAGASLCGIGELGRSVAVVAFVALASPPLLLFSLPTMLLSFSGFASLEAVFSLLTSSLASCLRVGLIQVGISQETPVKLFSGKPRLFHRRHGFPVLSRARKPALMAPWLALGPSLWCDGPAPFGLVVVLGSPSLHAQISQSPPAPPSPQLSRAVRMKG